MMEALVCHPLGRPPGDPLTRIANAETASRYNKSTNAAFAASASTRSTFFTATLSKQADS